MKILLVGPSKSGKSALASFLAGISDGAVPAQPPLPTVGCRILELERSGVPVELWDVSGDQSYENCWPAIKHNADGIIFVYSSEAVGQAVRFGGRGATPPPAARRRVGGAPIQQRAAHAPSPTHPNPTRGARRRSWSCFSSGLQQRAASLRSAARATRCRKRARRARRPRGWAACSQSPLCCAPTAARACGAHLIGLWGGSRRLRGSRRPHKHTLYIKGARPAGATL